MKKIILFLFVSVLCWPALGADLDSAKLAERGRHKAARAARYRIEGKDNNLFIGFSTSLTGHNKLIASVKAEYSRQVRGNFYLGCAASVNLNGGTFLSYDWSGDGLSPYRNTVSQNIYKLDAMAFYNFPVISDCLFFRVGGGVGVGYHQMVDRFGEDNYRGGDKVLPYFNIEAAWIWRITRGFELKLSPTAFFAPSQFSFSPVKLGAPTDATPYLWDPGFSLMLGWRF